MRRNSAGFTLIEVMVGIAVTSIIALAAVAGAMSIIQTLRRSEVSVESYDRAKILMDHLVTEAQQVGGGPMRPWMGLLVFDDVVVSGGALAPVDAKPGTDMMVRLVQDLTVPECAAESYDGVTFTGVSTPACCLDPSHGATRLMLAAADGAHWISNVSGAPGGCTLGFAQPGTATVFDRFPVAPATTSSEFPGATLLSYTEERWYINVNNELIRLTDPENDGTFASTLIADRVYDMQIALGYDVDGDGAISETASVNDEWLYNNFGDAMGTGTAMSGAQDNHLRMVHIAIAVGTDLRGTTGSSQNLNGPTLNTPDVLLRSTQSRAYLRNLNIFF